MSRSRKPSEAERRRVPPRMGRLACLPVFLPLEGQKVLVAGGSDAAAWKAELLAACGADVHVFAPTCGAVMAALIAEGAAAGSLVHHTVAWSPERLHGMALAVADAQDEAEAAAFAEAAALAGVPCNVIDRPDHCQFRFGSIVNRSPVVIGISTSGAAPVLGQAIRQRIETLLPLSLAGWAELATGLRGRVMDVLAPGAGRRAFWEGFVRRAFAGPLDAVAEAGVRSLLARIAASPDMARGRVTLVGAGPGDAGHLTMNAIRALQAADVVLYDTGVSGEVLELARREARRMLVGSVTGEGEAGGEGARLAATLAGQGREVVRLVPGDPREAKGCGLAGDLRALGVSVEIVAGIREGGMETGLETGRIAGKARTEAGQVLSGYPVSL
ncbi:NAD(P)-dependent oxidoreductase [Stappia sp.]|uniref:NAD(P)-dependent oxidoreductase n=1 Tax=Stappia sp. TaxID=1870903 RepID=UPI003A98E5AA